MPRRPLPESLALALPLTRDRAYELTEVIPIAATYTRYFMTTNGRKRGPYFRASFMRKGRSYVVYVGAQDRKNELEAAHAIVRAELEAEAAAVPPAIGDMLDRHAELYGNSAIPIANLKRTAPARVSSAAGARLVNNPTSEVGAATSAR